MGLGNRNHVLISDVIVFDLDDTLFAERDFITSGFSAVEMVLQRQFRCAGFLKIAIDLFNCGRRRNIIDEAVSALGLSPNPELISGLVNVYRSHWPQITL